MKYFRPNLNLFKLLPPQYLALAALACAVGLAVGCSSDDSDSSSDADSGTGSKSGSGSTGGDGDGDAGTGSTNGSGSSSGDGDGDGDGDSGEPDPTNTACGLATGTSSLAPGEGASIEEFEECTGVSYEAEGVAADILILVDQSTSMGDWTVSGVSSELAPDELTRWEALTGGLKEFIQSDKAQRLRVGLVYFGLPPGAEDREAGFNQSCQPSDYADPDVPIGLVSDQEAELLNSLDDHSPSNLTPTVPALEGALTYAQEWANENPGRPTVLVLATDGYPTECENKSISDLEALAEQFANPSDGGARVSTFVVGIGEVSNLERVAQAGGSNKAFFVGDCPTAVEDLTASLLRVASSSALCEFEMPQADAGQTVDPDQLNMVFTPANGGGEIVYRRDSSSGCGSGGWYYDDNDDPTKILVCPETCGNFGGGVVDIVLGCKTRSVQ